MCDSPCLPDQPVCAGARRDARVLRAVGGFLLCAVLGLAYSTDAVAFDRFRCIPADGSASYTSPGSCRADTDRREPLTGQEIAESQAVERRGRPFYRCTAADGSYSRLIRSGDCPSPTDTRTEEYAQQAIPSPRQPAPQPATQPEPVILKEPAAPAPAAVAPTRATQQVEAERSRKDSNLTSGLLLLVLAALGLFAGYKWTGWREAQAKAARQQTRRRAATTPQSNPATGSQSAPSQAAPGGVDLNQQARVLLDALDQGAEVPGGLDFRGALQQSKLDYSLESLDRVERLLKQIRLRQPPQREVWKTRPSAENFCLTLAYYMGTVLSRQTKLPVRWCTRAQAAHYMPAGVSIPTEDWARVIGVIGTSACVPLGLIEDKLFGDPGEISCRAYVERLAERLPGAAAGDENERCKTLLEAFFADREIHGGLKFRDHLKRLQLDYSLASLDRLEQLLKTIRARLSPDYEAFVNGADTQNFLRLAAFYIGMTVARAGNMSVKWLNYQAARQDLPELQFAFETTSLCVLNGCVYFPLGLVTEILLQPNPQRTMASWVREAMKHASAPTTSILRASLLAEPATPLDTQIAYAVTKAGFMAAWGMYAVESGAPSAPTLFVPGEDNTGTFTDFSFYSSQEEAFAAMDSQMRDNPHKLPFQIKSFDGYANLHTGRTDSITLELQIYPGQSAAAKQGLAITITCPYRHAKDPRGFAIYSPKVIESSAPSEWGAGIAHHFYLGVQSFKAGDFDWFKYLDESI